MKKPTRPTVERVITGTHPDTGVVHRLSFLSDGSLMIERSDYVSANTDGWRKQYEVLTEDPAKHEFLIRKILANPAVWVEEKLG